jgi:hypothetical protein
MREKHQSKQMGCLTRLDNGSAIPACFLVDGFRFQLNEPIRVYLVIVAVLPDYLFGMREGYTQPGSETGKSWFWKKEKPSACCTSRIIPKERPTRSIYGLVLCKRKSGCFSRLGVFEVENHHSTRWNPKAEMLWNDKFRGYHEETKWLMEGKQKVFKVI